MFEDGTTTTYFQDSLDTLEDEKRDFYTLGSFQNQQELDAFLEKNKQYEESKEAIDEWKKVNDIKYNPQEVYSRGQGFYSAIGAYSDLDLDLLLQNILGHIRDNKKAGAEFVVSAYTKPIGKTLEHLEGSSISFKIFPKSEDIKWATNTDVYSGSVWNASDKLVAPKTSEEQGVSYTKAPHSRHLRSKTVAPNLAYIIDNIAHQHNELGIELTETNFRLEYNDNIPNHTKKIVDSINSII